MAETTPVDWHKKWGPFTRPRMYLNPENHQFEDLSGKGEKYVVENRVVGEK